MRRKQDNDKLRLWQERFRIARNAWEDERDLMDERERLYAGEWRGTGKDEMTGQERQTPRVRNVCGEMIESQVTSDIPMPKVTALDEQDEWLAKIIEDMLRDEIRRLHAGTMMDLMQRTVPIQGGAFWHVEWDNSQRTAATIGELVLSTIHPKQFVPQPGITGDVEEMDWFFLEIPQTKRGIRDRYGVDVSQEAEEDADVRGYGQEEVSDDMVTQIAAFFRGPGGAIGRFSWVGDIVLEDFPDYLARRLRVCAQCGAEEPGEDVEPGEQTMDGRRSGGGPELPEDMVEPAPRARSGGGRRACPYCGGTAWEEQEQAFEEVWEPMVFPRPDDTALMIPGAREVLEDGEDPGTGEPVQTFRGRREPTRIPYYKPEKYPVILQRNVSRFGKLLGGSDIDKLRDDQKALNYLDWKMHEKISTGGSYMVLPEEDAYVEVNDQQMKVVLVKSPDKKAMLDVITMEADISQDMARAADIYEQVKQSIGVTDSFLGRRDPSATSGKAKEFAAAQTAGRQQSRATMRDAAWARVYQLMFMLKLAYADEPRSVVGNDANGQRVYREFNRYLFLRQDADGEWYWNDRFLFETDTAAPLATNQQAMWEEATRHFQSGAYGDPASIDTLILYWSQLAKLHYPTAEDIVSSLKEQRERQLEMEAMRQQIVVNQDNQMTINQPPMEVGTPQRV